MEEQQNNNSESRTFTQEEVTKMIGERLYEEKKKYGDYEELKAKAAQFDELQEKNKSELEKANEKATKLEAELEKLRKQSTIAEARAKVSKEMNVPAELLTADDEESCKAQAEAILKFAKPSEYPSVKKDNPPHHRESSDKDEAMREFAHQFFSKG